MKVKDCFSWSSRYRELHGRRHRDKNRDDPDGCHEKICQIINVDQTILIEWKDKTHS